VNPALQVQFESSYFGQPLTALVYSDGRVMYVSQEVKYILKADELLRTGTGAAAFGGGAGGGGGGSGDSGFYYDDDHRFAQRVSRQAEAGGNSGFSSGVACRSTTEVPLLTLYRHPLAPRERRR
jgi:hypothetical protein